jgi:Cof subfamily protein (haloacid dehalogenase superfamily)
MRILIAAKDESMTSIKLAALDVDGTLVRSDMTVTKRVDSAVRSLMDAGVTVAVVTGRTTNELKEIRARFPQIRYFVVSNGARGYDTVTGEDFYQNLLPLSIAKTVAKETLNMQVMLEAYADGAAYVPRACWENRAFYDAAYLLHPSLSAGRVPIDDVHAFLDERRSDIEKLYISFHDPSDLDKLYSFCGNLPVDQVVSIQNGLEINQSGVEKGAGFRALCDYLDVSQEETAAVGDGFADIPLFQSAGLSIAMGNATPHVQKSAKLVAPDNNSDGADWAIEQILNTAK